MYESHSHKVRVTSPQNKTIEIKNFICISVAYFFAETARKKNINKMQTQHTHDQTNLQAACRINKIKATTTCKTYLIISKNELNSHKHWFHETPSPTITVSTQKRTIWEELLLLIQHVQKHIHKALIFGNLLHYKLFSHCLHT